MSAQKILTPNHWAWLKFFELLGYIIEERGCTGDFCACEWLLADQSWPADIDANETLQFFERHGKLCDCQVFYEWEEMEREPAP